MAHGSHPSRRRTVLPDAVALGPGLALLAWCYDQVERDGSMPDQPRAQRPSLASPMARCATGGRAQAGHSSPRSPQRARQGWLVRFAPRWLDWRILQHNYPDRRDFGDQEPVSAEISADTQAAEISAVKTRIPLKR